MLASSVPPEALSLVHVVSSRRCPLAGGPIYPSVLYLLHMAFAAVPSASSLLLLWQRNTWEDVEPTLVVQVNLTTSLNHVYRVTFPK